MHCHINTAFCLDHEINLFVFFHILKTKKNILHFELLQNTYQTTQVHRNLLVLGDDQETAASKKSLFSIFENKNILLDWEEHCG